MRFCFFFFFFNFFFGALWRIIAWFIGITIVIWSRWRNFFLFVNFFWFLWRFIGIIWARIIWWRSSFFSWSFFRLRFFSFFIFNKFDWWITAFRIWRARYLFFLWGNRLFCGFLSFLTAFITFSTCIWWCSWSFDSNNFFLWRLIWRITWIWRAAYLFLFAYFCFLLDNSLFDFFNFLFDFFNFLFGWFFLNYLRRWWWIWIWRWRFDFLCYFLFNKKINFCTNKIKITSWKKIILEW